MNNFEQTPVYKRVWHITHRCHQNKLLLKFKRDKRRWLFWLFESRKRFGLTILDYHVASNHVHLIVEAHDRLIIAKSMQLISGRTAREYNIRKNQSGAFWNGKYSATLLEGYEDLIYCIGTIGLNITHDSETNLSKSYAHSGLSEIFNPRQRYRIINIRRLCDLTGIADIKHLREEYLIRK